MITSKKIIYGVVLAGSFALLFAQFLGASRKAPDAPPPVELPAEAGADTVAAAPVPAESAEVVTLAVSAADDGAAQASELTEAAPAALAAEDAALAELGLEDPLARLERSLGRLRNFLPAATSGSGLDRMARESSKKDKTPQASMPIASLSLPSSAEPNQTGSPASESQPDEARASASQRSDAPPPVDEMVTFLGAHPLAGIIHGESGAAAMFGGRIVRAGDQLVPGDAVVKSIEPRGVLIKYRGQDMRLEMPPFRPRKKPASDSSSGESSGGAGGGQSGGQSSQSSAGSGGAASASSTTTGTPTPSPTTQTANVGPTQTDTQSEQVDGK